MSSLFGGSAGLKTADFLRRWGKGQLSLATRDLAIVKAKVHCRHRLARGGGGGDKSERGGDMSVRVVTCQRGDICGGGVTSQRGRVTYVRE